MNDAATTAEQTKAAAANVFENTRNIATGALNAGAKAAENAFDQQLKVAEKVCHYEYCAMIDAVVDHFLFLRYLWGQYLQQHMQPHENYFVFTTHIIIFNI